MKRKRRIPCRIEGCESPIIHDRLMCHPCWKTIPSGARKKHTGLWRELRPFINRIDNTIKDTADAAQCLSLIKEHRESCNDLIARANNIRAAKAIPADNSIETELKGMGLI